jgi:acyl-CoA thioester hydrolase
VISAIAIWPFVIGTMPHEFHSTRRVEFADTDMAGIIHFSAFFRYMEETEHAFLRSLGLSVVLDLDGAHVSWPRVAASCTFVRPVRFEHVLDVYLTVTEKREKSVTYDFRFEHEGHEIARGEMTSVCCRIEANGRPRAIAMPPPFDENIQQAPPST